MFLALLPRLTRAINITSPTNNVNLYTEVGSPTTPLNVICIINANVSSTNVYSPAFRTGETWPVSSFVYIVNNSNIIGASGETTYGESGVGGNGGNGGGIDGDGFNLNGTSGSAGSAGGAGYIGGSGGIALQGDSNTGITLLFNNTNGNIIAGYAGIGSGGLGGGGGGGGGGRNV